VVTFLFTDVEGSTRRCETDADAMREALAAHDEVLRDTETLPASTRARLEAKHGDPLAALEYLTLAVRNSTTAEAP
jgi:hypothetical protein